MNKLMILFILVITASCGKSSSDGSAPLAVKNRQEHTREVYTQIEKDLGMEIHRCFDEFKKFDHAMQFVAIGYTARSCLSIKDPAKLYMISENYQRFKRRPVNWNYLAKTILGMESQ